MLVFGERGKLEYPGKNLSEQSREPTNSHMLSDPGIEARPANPGHIGGRPVLSPLRQHCSHSIYYSPFQKSEVMLYFIQRLDSAIQRINHYQNLLIYEMDSAIQSLNNWGLKDSNKGAE